MAMLTVGSLLGDSFRFVAANLRAIGAWALVLLLLGLASLIVMHPLMAAQLATLQTGVRQLPSFGPFVLFMLLGVGVGVVLYAAAFRAVFRPEDRGLAYMRLGGEEAVLFATIVVLLIGCYVAMIVAVLGLVVIGVAIAATTSHGGALAYAAIATILFVVGTAYVLVRLSLVAPLSFLRREIAIGPAWRLTRGHGWTLLGAYLLLWLVTAVVLVAVLLVSSPPLAAMLAHPGDPLTAQRVTQWQLERAGGGITLAAAGGMIVSALVNAVMTALGGGMAAIATLRLLGDGAEPQSTGNDSGS